MSVASQITRLQTAKNNLRTAINSKLTSGLLTTSDSISNYASAVNRIPTNTPITDPDELMEAYANSIGGASTTYMGAELLSTSLMNGGFFVDIIDRSTFTLRFTIGNGSGIYTPLAYQIVVRNSDTGGIHVFGLTPFLADFVLSTGSGEKDWTSVESGNWPVNTKSIISARQFDWCIDPNAVCAGQLYFNANEVRCIYCGYDI